MLRQALDATRFYFVLAVFCGVSLSWPVLDAAACYFFAERRNVTVDDARRVLNLSAIMDFYTADFLRHAPSLAVYVNRYRATPVPTDYAVRFFDYDWTINRQPGT